MQQAQSFIINGSFDGIISPLDRGFAYGDGVFRTMLVRDGLPQCWPQHYQKLVADCAALNIVCPSAELLISDLQQLMTTDLAAENTVSVAKIIITRGEGERGYASPAITNPTRVIIKSPMRSYPGQYFSEGVALQVCDTLLAAQTKLAGVKHLNRIENVLARMEWSDPTIFDGILLDANQNVIECTAANIFIVNGPVLTTPDLKQCGVAGVTRQRLIDLAHLLGYTIKIDAISLEQIFSSEHVFISNSLYGMFQVKSIMQRTWQASQLAEDFRQLLKTNH